MRSKVLIYPGIWAAYVTVVHPDGSIEWIDVDETMEGVAWSAAIDRSSGSSIETPVSGSISRYLGDDALRWVDVCAEVAEPMGNEGILRAFVKSCVDLGRRRCGQLIKDVVVIESNQRPLIENRLLAPLEDQLKVKFNWISKDKALRFALMYHGVHDGESVSVVEIGRERSTYWRGCSESSDLFQEYSQPSPIGLKALINEVAALLTDRIKTEFPMDQAFVAGKPEIAPAIQDLAQRLVNVYLSSMDERFELCAFLGQGPIPVSFSRKELDRLWGFLLASQCPDIQPDDHIFVLSELGGDFVNRRALSAISHLEVVQGSPLLSADGNQRQIRSLDLQDIFAGVAKHSEDGIDWHDISAEKAYLTECRLIVEGQDGEQSDDGILETGVARLARICEHRDDYLFVRLSVITRDRASDAITRVNELTIPLPYPPGDGSGRRILLQVNEDGADSLLLLSRPPEQDYWVGIVRGLCGSGEERESEQYRLQAFQQRRERLHTLPARNSDGKLIIYLEQQRMSVGDTASTELPKNTLCRYLEAKGSE